MGDDQEPSLSARTAVDRILDVVEAQHAMRELAKLDPRIVAVRRAGLQLKLMRAKYVLAKNFDELAHGGDKPA